LTCMPCRLLASGWQIACVAFVIAVALGWPAGPRSLTHDLPTNVRLAAAALGLVTGGGFLWLNFKFDLVALHHRRLWVRILVLVTLAGSLFVVRPRLHWGDSAALVSALDGGVHRWNPRWSTSMVGLAYLFNPLRVVMSGTLFLTLVYIVLGCFIFTLFMATLRTVSDGEKIPGSAMLFVLASPATLFLMSGYLEIYAIPHFGVAAFLWAAATFSAGRRWMSPLLFGSITALASMLYVGNLILLPLSTVFIGMQLSAQHALSRTLFRKLLGFATGAVVGVYFSLWLVIGGSLPSLPRVFTALAVLIREPIEVIRSEAGGTTWYAPLVAAQGVIRAREFADTWSLYGFFGLLFLLALVVFSIFDRQCRNATLAEAKTGFLPMLAALDTFYLAASYVKTRPMGWRDWDVLIYAAYPTNLLAACLLIRLQPGSIGRLGRTLSLCASVWCSMVYAYLNPVRSEWSGLPARRRASAFEGYHLTQRIAPSEAADRGIRETDPFP
jgi:hypothetical protein